MNVSIDIRRREGGEGPQKHGRWWPDSLAEAGNDWFESRVSPHAWRSEEIRRGVREAQANELLVVKGGQAITTPQGSFHEKVHCRTWLGSGNRGFKVCL